MLDEEEFSIVAAVFLASPPPSLPPLPPPPPPPPAQRETSVGKYTLRTSEKHNVFRAIARVDNLQVFSVTTALRTREICILNYGVLDAPHCFESRMVDGVAQAIARPDGFKVAFVNAYRAWTMTVRAPLFTNRLSTNLS
jgi:hypothetical protein